MVMLKPMHMCLGKDPNGDADKAGTYSYPVGKGGEVYYNGVRAANSAAGGGMGANKNSDIQDAASKLLASMKPKDDKEEDVDSILLKEDTQMKCPDCGKFQPTTQVYCNGCGGKLPNNTNGNNPIGKIEDMEMKVWMKKE